MKTEYTKACSQCGAFMIQRETGQVSWQYWCGCGHTERGIRDPQADEQAAQEQRESLNRHRRERG